MEFTVNYSLLTTGVSWEGLRSSSEGRGKPWGKVELADPCDSASMPSFLSFTSHLYNLILSRYFHSSHYRGVLPQSFRSAVVWREGIARKGGWEEPVDEVARVCAHITQQSEAGELPSPDPVPTSSFWTLGFPRASCHIIWMCEFFL